MALVFSNVGASVAPDINDSTDSASYSTGTYTPPTAGLLLAFVMSSRALGPDTPALSGNGLTWVQIGATLNAGSGRGLSLFAANAAGSSAGITTVSFGTNVQLGCMVSFLAVTGADLSGGVAAAFVQNVKNGSTANATAPTLTLAAASNTLNRAVACFFHVIQEVSNARANWTKADDLQGAAFARGMITEWRADAFETTASASWATGSGWGGFAVEIKAQVDASVTVGAVVSTSNLELSCTLVDSDLIFNSTFKTTALANVQGVYSRLVSFVGGFGQSDPMYNWDGTGALPTLNEVRGGVNVFNTAELDNVGKVAATLGIPLDWIVWRLPWQLTETGTTPSTLADYYNSDTRRLRSDQGPNFVLYLRRIGKYLMETWGARRFKIGSEMKGYQTGDNGWDYSTYFTMLFTNAYNALMLAADDAAGVVRSDILVGGPYPVLSHKGGSINQVVTTDTFTTVTTPAQSYRTKDDAIPATWNMNQPTWGNPNIGPVKATAEFLKLCAANSIALGMYSVDYALFCNDFVIKTADDFSQAEAVTRDVSRWGKRLLQDIAGGQFSSLQNWSDITEYYIKPQGTLADTTNYLYGTPTSNPPGIHPSGPFLPTAQLRPYFAALKAIGLAVCVEEGIRSPSFWSPFGSGDGRTAPHLDGGQNVDEQRYFGEAIVHKGGTGDGGAAEGTLTVVGQVLKWINQNFAIGTPIRAVTVSDSSKVYALANLTQCLLVNKTNAAQVINLNSNSVSLGAYETQLVTIGTAYTLTAATGSLVETGNAAILKCARRAAATVSTVTETGPTAKLLRSAKVGPTVASFALSGPTPLLNGARIVTGAFSAFAMTANAARFIHQPPYAVLASAIGYAVTAPDLVLTISRILGTGQSSFALTAPTVLATAGYRLSAVMSSFALTGESAGLLTARSARAAASSVVVSTFAAALFITRHLSAAQASYAWIGENAALARGVFLVTEQAAYNLSGEDSALLTGHHLLSQMRSVGLSGQSVNLTYTLLNSYLLSTDAAQLHVTAFAAGLAGRHALTAAVGVIALSGSDVGQRAARLLVANADALTLLLVAIQFGGLLVAEEPIPRDQIFVVEYEERTMVVEYEDRTFVIE